MSETCHFEIKDAELLVLQGDRIIVLREYLGNL